MTSPIDSTIQRIPAEILLSFFSECVPIPTGDNPGPTLSHRHPAVVLSHVSRTWRQLVLETPSLWSGMHIQTPGSNSFSRGRAEEWHTEPNRTAKSKDAVEAWVARSAEQPLTIVLDLPDTSNIWHFQAQSACEQICTDILTALFLCANRWMRLHINLALPASSSVLFMRTCGTLPANQLSSLEALSINLVHFRRPMFGDVGSDTIFAKSLFFGPSLRHVRLEGCWIIGDGFRGAIRGWASLTDLEISPSHSDGNDALFDASNLVYLFEAFPLLQRAKFLLAFRWFSNDVAERAVPIVVPQLKFLSLGGQPMGPGLAQSLVLPSLQALSLVFDPYRTPADNGPPDAHSRFHEGILEFLRRFGLQLKSLALNHDMLPAASFPSCLDMLNNDRVESLSLINKYFPHTQTEPGPFTSAVRAMRAVRGVQDRKALTYLARPGVFPRLKRLEMSVRNQPLDRKCEMALVDVVAARRRQIQTSKDHSNQGTEAYSGGRDEAENDSESSTPRPIEDVHVTFIWARGFKIIDELGNRGVDLVSDPFSIRLNYPESCDVMGERTLGRWVV